MEKVEVLNQFYENELFSTIEKFEEKRKKIRTKILFIIFLIIWNSCTIYFFFLLSYDEEFDLLAFFITGIFVLSGFVYRYFKKDYTNNFKQEVIKPLIDKLDEELTYSANLYVSRSIFNRSMLFKFPDKYSGNDLIIGKIDSVNIEFSDVHAQKKYKDNKGRTKYSTIFQGLFIVAKFNKRFHGSTIVLPDTAQNSFGDLIGSWLQSNNPNRDELVKLDNPEFEKEFVVYSNDQIEARYILTPSLMEKILSFQQKSRQDIYLSFIQEHIHIAIDYKKDLFEPTIFTSLLNKELFIEYINSLTLAVSVVKELNLNQNIWKKID